DLKQYDRAASYLRAAADFETPDNTRPAVWITLGRALLRAQRYEESIAPFDHYLKTVTKADIRAKALLSKATALNESARHKEAQACVEEALKLQKQGRTNAHAWILSGDIAFAQGKYEEASKCYIIPARLFHDPQIT